MRIFDFVIQTIVILAVLFALSTGTEAIIWIALFQFFMGCWQLTSAIATTVKYRKDDGIRKKMMRIYWLLVIIYFVGLGGIYAVIATMMSSGEMYLSVWFFSAWLIALFYYAATIKMIMDNNKDRKTFLDVVN